MRQKSFLAGLAFIVMTGGLFSSVTPAVYAQQRSNSGPGMATSVTDKDLNAFVKAYVEYKRIQQAYQPSLDKVQDPKEKQRIASEANAKIKKAIEKNGLTSDKYNRIFTAVNNNQELRKKALKLIDQERKRS